MRCLAVLSVLSAASSPCPDLNLIHYKKGRLKPIHSVSDDLKSRISAYRKSYRPHRPSRG
ncbi:adhesin [Neisseria mucosa]|uniref:Adhesin n=1 Tax=Neisseria mucosa TaxID=488 RepID=A0ABN4Y3V2_NEIMU|nr:adhesin [Neisseria mucosa]